MTSGPRIFRYLIAGLLIGGFWYLNRSRPLWEEAARTVVVFSVLIVVLRFRLRRRGVNVHLIPLIATKVVLVVAAALVEQALEHRSVSHLALDVSIGLGIVVCLAGAVGDRFFFSRSADPEPANAARR